MKRMIVWLPTIVLMLGIFYFSHQPAEESSDLSGGICYKIVSIVSEVMDYDLDESEKLLWTEEIQHPIRKLAHLTEYALLGITVAFGIVYGSDFGQGSVWKQYVLIQMIGSSYAVSDEIHQLFVPGRAGMISDVLIDSVGVLIGWGVFVVLENVCRKPE